MTGDERRTETHEVQRPVDETRDAEEDASDKVKSVRAHVAVTRYRRHSRAVGYCRCVIRSDIDRQDEEASRQTDRCQPQQCQHTQAKNVHLSAVVMVMY